LRSPRTWLPVILAAFGVVGNILLNTGLRDRLVQEPWLLLGLTAITLLCASVLPIVSFLRAESRYHRRESIGALQRLLAEAIRRIFPGEDPGRIRANVMTVQGDELAILSSVNMDLYPDLDVRWGYDQGCAGTAWKRASEAPMSERWVPVLAPNAQVSADDLTREWRLTKEQIQKTSHVLWVLSTPLFITEGEQSRFVGVLNFDGVSGDLSNMGRLRDESIHKDCADIGDYFASELVRRGIVHL